MKSIKRFWRKLLAKLTPLPLHGESNQGVLREVLGLYDQNRDPIYFSTSNHMGQIADHLAIWEAIWSNRDDLYEIAHTHPVGPDHFSETDITTMRSIVTGLGRGVRFWVITPRWCILQEVEFRDGSAYFPPNQTLISLDHITVPPWVPDLIRKSNMTSPWFQLGPDDVP